MRSLLFVMVVVFAAIVGNGRLAYAASSEIFDDVGDATPAYLDVVHAKFTEQIGKGVFVLMMELDAAVPDPPVDAFVAYNWQLSTTATPPFRNDFIVVVRWIGGAWDWNLQDLRALNAGTGPEIDTPITTVRFDGATEKITLTVQQLGDPVVVRWRVLTRLAPSPAAPVDRAPNSGFHVFFR
jgi:hypothetical protein